MHDRRLSGALVVSGLLGLLAGAQAQRDGSVIGPSIPLPRDDQAVLEQYLGKGVVGKPVPAPVIDDAGAWYGLHAGTWRLAGQGGKDAVDLTLSRADDKDGPMWRSEFGPVARFLQLSTEGHIEVISQVDHKQGVVSRFSPPERRLSKGLRPGESREVDVDVRVFDLKNPDHLEHQGTLRETSTYVGAYEVTVPAGTYAAVLIRLDFDGHVGPASVKDSVHYLLARDVGPVAFVENKHISAMLFYHDVEKRGLMLQKPHDAAEAP